MKILLANCVYKHGSTGKILYDIKKQLESLGDKVIVAYGRQQLEQGETNVYKFCTEAEGYFHKIMAMVGMLQYKGSIIATRRLIHIIKKEQPNVVHLHCMNGFCVNLYRLLKYLSINKIRTIITHHAEFYYTGSCGHAYGCNQWITDECIKCPNIKEATYSRTFGQTHRAWRLMYEVINSFDNDKLTFTAVSPWVKERSSLSSIVNKYKCEVVLNGVETSIFKRELDKNLLKSRISILKEKVLLFVTAEFRPGEKQHNKGGWYLVELAKKMPEYSFVVVASYNNITEKLPKNICVWGRSKDQRELAKLYSSSDVTLLLSKRETFSMVCAESLCCGTPVVGFKAGGPESIAIGEYCEFVDYGDLLSLQQKLYVIGERTIDHFQLSRTAHIKYGKESMATRYVQLYYSNPI